MARRAEQQQSFLKQGSTQHVPRGPLCICLRPQQEVFCMDCGYAFRGRQRIHCPVHPMTMFLLDITGCPNCKSSNITERPKM